MINATKLVLRMKRKIIVKQSGMRTTSRVNMFILSATYMMMMMTIIVMILNNVKKRVSKNIFFNI
jgi:hypothetical protein